MGIETLVFHSQDGIDISLRQFVDRRIIVDRLDFSRHLFHAFFIQCFPVIHVSFHTEHTDQYDNGQKKERTQTFYPFHSV